MDWRVETNRLSMLSSKLFWLPVACFCALAAINYVAAETLPKAQNSAPTGAEKEVAGVSDWLQHLREASKNRAYVGTYVVSSGGSMSSAKIWHVCEGDQQVERIESLSGAPRSVFRHNDRVLTFMPDQKLVRSEKRDGQDIFSGLLQSADSRIADYYRLRAEGVERVAGVEADVVLLAPKDNLRFGYRVWTEPRKGLVVKLQTLDTDGRVLEQAAFSELQLDAPVKMEKLLQMMGKVQGYRMEQTALVKTTASAEGWLLKAPVAGFKALSCYKRPMPASVSGDDPLQWVFSDGLASVSIFLEPFDRQRHDKGSVISMGATQTMTRQLGGYWLTLMGEVPISTLRLFANALEHKK